MQVATTQTIKAYFSGTQIAPFGAVCLSMNTAAMVFPQIWRILMSNYGWNTTFYVLGIDMDQSSILESLSRGKMLFGVDFRDYFTCMRSYWNSLVLYSNKPNYNYNWVSIDFLKCCKQKKTQTPDNMMNEVKKIDLKVWYHLFFDKCESVQRIVVTWQNLGHVCLEPYMLPYAH